MYLSLTPAVPGAAEFVIVDAETNPNMRPWVLIGQDWGNPTWEHAYAGARGTQGARPAAGSLPNRTVRLALRLYGTSDDDVANRMSELSAVMGLMRRFGGTITRRTHRQSYRQFLRVLTTPGEQLPEWDKRADNNHMVHPGLEFTCEPYAEGDPMAWEQTYATDADAATMEVVSGTGTLGIETHATYGAHLGPSGTSRLFALDALRGYQYGDVRVQGRMSGDQVSNAQAVGVLLRWVDANNWLACTLESNGTTGYLRVRLCVAGSESVVAEDATASSLYPSFPWWVTGWIEGNTVYANGFNLSEPTPFNEHVTPNCETSWTLSTAQAAVLGAGVTSRVGVVIDSYNNAADLAGLYELRVQPYFYSGTDRPTVGNQPLLGPIPGDAPAKASVAITTPASNTVSARWALIGWDARKGARNMCWNGAFEEDADGWSASAVSGVTAAATAASYSTVNGDYGVGSLYIDASTTDTSGATFRMYDRFRKGITYRATLRTTIGGTSGNWELVLGVSGDLAVGTSAVVPNGYQERTVEWTPTADYQSAYVGFRADGTHGGTVYIDRVRVHDTSHGASVVDHQDGGEGGYSPLSVVPAVGHEQETGTTDTSATSLIGTVESAGTISGSGSLALSYIIDPALTYMDDYTQGELDLEVWARVNMDNDLNGLRAALWANAPVAAYNADTLGTRRTAQPGGLTGRAVVVPDTTDANRLVRLGILSLAIDPERPGPWRVTLYMSWASGSANSLTVDYLAFVPARSRVLSPTGVQDSLGGFPAFIDTNGDEVTKVVRSDLSSVVQAPPSRALYPDHGLGGSSLLELPAGNVDMLVMLSDYVPDDPELTDVSCAVAIPAAIAVSPVPRWAHLRDA